MNPLYFLEHQFLPSIVYPGPEGPQISPFLLGNAFGSFCTSVLKDLAEAGEGETLTCTEKDFTAEGLEIRNEHTGAPQCYVLRMHFPFQESWAQDTLCPRAYLVHGLQGEDPRYYTVEYDAGAMGYRLYSWDGEGNHISCGSVENDESQELPRILKLEKARMHDDGVDETSHRV